MLLPQKEKMDFVPAGTPPGNTRRRRQPQRPDHAPAQPAARPGAAQPSRPIMQTLSVKPAGAAPIAPAELPNDFSACNAMAMQFYNAGVYDRAEVVFADAPSSTQRRERLDAQGSLAPLPAQGGRGLSCFDRASSSGPTT